MNLYWGVPKQCQEPSRVCNGVWVGSIYTTTNEEFFEKNNIKGMVSVGEKPAHIYVSAHLHIDIEDDSTTDIIKHFEKTNRFIDEIINDNGCVFIHCFAGVSRSPTIAMAYLMWKYDIDHTDAFNKIHQVRSVVLPNNGFRNKLRTYHYILNDMPESPLPYPSSPIPILVNVPFKFRRGI